MRDDNGCEDLDQLSVKSWCEFKDDYDRNCDDSEDEYQVAMSKKFIPCPRYLMFFFDLYMRVLDNVFITFVLIVGKLSF